MKPCDHLARTAVAAALAVTLVLLVNAAVASGEGLLGLAGGGPSIVAAPSPSTSDGDAPAAPVPDGGAPLAIAGVIVALAALVAATLVLALVFAPRMAKHLLCEGRDGPRGDPAEGSAARTNCPPSAG